MYYRASLIVTFPCEKEVKMSDNNVFLIYQLKQGSEIRDFRFEPLERIKASGMAVERGRYNHIYTGALEPGDKPDIKTLEGIFERFNIDRPADFAGHSLSMSDVVVLRCDGNATAHYADRFGFAEVPEFLEGPYKYYSLQRPVDIGTFPKTESGPVKIVNFDKRAWMENATFRAWGYLQYDAPLTQKQIDDYELRAAPDNPDHVKLSPYQLEAQAQVVGKWEQSKRVPDIKRLTWWHGDFGVFVKKDFVTQERLAERFGEVMESKARAAQNRAEKRPMEEQVQVVGHWEEMKGLPENERFTWHKPSISAFALREPIVGPEQLERRYIKAKEELTRADEKTSAPKPIAEQLKEGAEQAARDNAARPAPAKDTDKNR